MLRVRTPARGGAGGGAPDWAALVPAALGATLLIWLVASVVFAGRLHAAPPAGAAFAGDRGGGPRGLAAARAPPPAPSPAAPSPPAAAASNGTAVAADAAAHATDEDARVSGLGPALSAVELRGGWRYDRAVYDHALKRPEAAIVSYEHPRVLLVKGFLSPAERATLLAAAGEGFERSEVVCDGPCQTNAQRTSDGVWLNGARRTEAVRRVQARVAELTGIPEEFGESIYVLRYADGQKYDAHSDNCHHGGGAEALTPACRGFLARAGGPRCGAGAGSATCGDRVATVIMYLQSAEEGGATVFPRARAFAPPPLAPDRAEARPLEARAARRLAARLPGRAGGGLGRADPARDAAARRAAAEEADALAEAAAAGDLPFALYGDDADADEVGAEAGGEVKMAEETAAEKTDADAGAATGAAPAPARAPWYCASDAEVLRVAPAPGDAVLFYSYLPDAAEGAPAVADDAALHAGCPPLRGTKIIATRWIRTAEFH